MISPSGRLRRFVDEPQDRFGFLLALLVTTFVVSGLDGGGEVRLLVGLLNALVIVVAFTSVGLRGHRTRVGALLAFALLGSVLVSPFRGTSETMAGSVLQAGILGVVTLAVVRRVMSHRHVTGQTILGAVAAYFLIGQFFAWVYVALPDYADGGVLEPAFADEIPMYYSYVVLTTLGFGDVVPVGELSQRVTVVEALTGQIFLSVLVARLVSLYSRPASDPS